MQRKRKRERREISTNEKNERWQMVKNVSRAETNDKSRTWRVKVDDDALKAVVSAPRKFIVPQVREPVTRWSCCCEWCNGDDNIRFHSPGSDTAANRWNWWSRVLFTLVHLCSLVTSSMQISKGRGNKSHCDPTSTESLNFSLATEINLFLEGIGEIKNEEVKQLYAIRFH